jgi:putative acetyltransferase
MDSLFPLRLAVDADGPALSALIAAVFAEYDGVLFVAAEFPELAAPSSHFAAAGGALWVAEGEGGLAGSIGIVNRGAGTFELLKVYVAAHARGGGLAAQLLATATAFAQQRAGRELILWSDARFTRGHGFYRKHGFDRLPGERALHDASATIEYPFRKGLAAVQA